MDFDIPDDLPDVPENVPRLSSFHDQIQQPTVPEVSVMFDSGLEFLKKPDESISVNRNSSSKTQNSKAKNNSSSNETDSMSDKQNKHSNDTKIFTPNKRNKMSTPHKMRIKNHPHEYDTGNFKENIDVNDKNESGQDRYINPENHLIEPIEPYSVWKYKNKHMLGNIEDDRTTSGDGKQTMRNEINYSHSPNDQQRRRTPQGTQHEEKTYREYCRRNNIPFKIIEVDIDPNDDNPRSYEQIKKDYEKYIGRGLRSGQQGNQIPNTGQNQQSNQFPSSDQNKYPYTFNSIYNRNELINHGARNTNDFPLNSNTNISSPLPSNIDHRIKTSPVNDKIEKLLNYQVNELVKLVDYQKKHIELLNEQIYNLTVQSKTNNNDLHDKINKQNELLNGINEKVNSIKEVKSEDIENIIKKYFDKINIKINNICKQQVDNDGDGDSESSIKNKTDKTGKNDSESNKNSNEKDNVVPDTNWENIEKKLIELINAKLNIHKNTNQQSKSKQLKYKQKKECLQKLDEEEVDDEDDSESDEETNDNVAQNYKCTKKSNYDKIQKYGNIVKNKKDNISPILKMKNDKILQKIFKKTDKQNSIELQNQFVSKASTSRQINQPHCSRQNYNPEHYTQSNRRTSTGETNRKDKRQSNEMMKHTNDVRRYYNAHDKKNSKKMIFRGESDLMNEDTSMTLNVRNLPVVKEHIPSPEPSVHIAMGACQSSSDGDTFDEIDLEDYQVDQIRAGDSDDDEPYEPVDDGNMPTFYTNVVGKVRRIMQGDPQQDDDPDMYSDEEKFQQYRPVQTRKSNTTSNKKVKFNKKNSLNPNVPEMLNSPSDKSKRSMTTVVNTNLSFASLQYLYRYQIPPPPMQGIYQEEEEEDSD